MLTQAGDGPAAAKALTRRTVNRFVTRVTVGVTLFGLGVTVPVTVASLR